MPKPDQPVLLYDPMPRPDVKLPPIREPKFSTEDAQKLVDQDQKEETADYLSNLVFD